MVIIKNAKVQPIIGVESNASTGKTEYVLTLLIEAKGINPKYFKSFKGKHNIKINKV